MNIRINYGKCGGGITVERGKSFAITRECDSVTWSTRSGTVRLVDGSEYEADTLLDNNALLDDHNS